MADDSNTTFTVPNNINRPEDQPRPKVPDEQKQSPPSPDQYGDERGVPLNMPFSTPWVDNTYEIYRSIEDIGPTIKQLQTMRRNDGQARALYRLLTIPIRSALPKATFVPADGGEAEAEFIEQMFTLPPDAGGMTVTFQKIMAQILMALFDGFAAFEQVYHRPTEGPLKGKYTLKKLAHRPAETVTFLMNENGSYAGLRQRTMFLSEYIDKRIERENSFYYSCQEEEQAFFGVSMFQAAFKHYDLKARLYFLSNLAGQRQAVGTRVGKFGPNASKNDKDRFAKHLSDLGTAQWMMFPDGWDVKTLTEQGSFDYLAYINHHNSQMSKSVLASFFDKDQGDSGGGGKLVDFGGQTDEHFIRMILTIMEEIAANINHYIIPKFIDWNFSSGKYPQFAWGQFTEEQKQSMRKTFEKLSTAAGDKAVTPEFMRALEKNIADDMGLKIDYDAVQKRLDEEDAVAKDQQEMQTETQEVSLESQKVQLEQAKAQAEATAQGADPNAPQGDQNAPTGDSGGSGSNPDFEDVADNSVDSSEDYFGDLEGETATPIEDVRLSNVDDDLVALAHQLLMELKDDDN